jgi:hypothetical protein
MSPIPGEPHDRSDPQELTTEDGRKVKFRVPGMPPPVKPVGTEERGSEEPPREDPRPPVNPNFAGP